VQHHFVSEVNMNDPVEVLVVGAGPTGLTLSCDLRRRGVLVRTIDGADHGFRGSRAKGLQPRTLEVFDDLGILPDLQQRGSVYPKLGLHLGPLTVSKTMIKHHAPTEAVPYADTMLISQVDTDTALQGRLEALGGRVEYGSRLVSYKQDEDGVVATVETPASTELVRARFLVGADGGASAVRASAGIQFVGSTDETDRMIVADVTLTGLSRDRWHVWPRNKGHFMALCPLPDGDKFQLMLKLRPDEEASLTRDTVDRLVQAFVGGAKLRVDEIHWSSVWRPNIRLAERYRSGNVFLAGDAAHVHPPTGAQGLNTGVQDAYNLGWKLGQVLAGAPDALLDTYEAERHPVAARVLGLSTNLYARMSDRPVAAATRGDEERQLALTYRGGPLAPNSEERTTSVGAGDRAPDARYTDTDGQARRLFDVFRGPHFTLLAIGDEAIQQIPHTVWRRAGASLKTIAIPGKAGPGLSRIYGVRGSTQILVRPDGYVADVAGGSASVGLAKHVQLMLPVS
jgi:2-polyprenyl-6-methoxyphenol hydroxylase-like FAD-dependent oxidoreductase